MKCFERLVLKHIKSSHPSSCDPQQFAYRQNRSTEDTMNMVLYTKALSRCSNSQTGQQMSLLRWVSECFKASIQFQHKCFECFSFHKASLCPSLVFPFNGKLHSHRAEAPGFTQPLPSVAAPTNSSKTGVWLPAGVQKPESWPDSHHCTKINTAIHYTLLYDELNSLFDHRKNKTMNLIHLNGKW